MIGYYLGLLDDRQRIAAMECAIRATVRPDDVVVDLGCGVGSYAIFAALAGARRVFAVESSPAIGYAREMAQRNGVSVEFIAGDAREVELPERATVLIYEDYPTGLLDGKSSAILRSVVPRWMQEGFRVLPQGATLGVAPLTSARVRREIDPFADDDSHCLDLSSLREASFNTVHDFHGLADAELLATPQTALEQDLVEPLPEHWRKELLFDCTATASLDGICLWHDLIISSTDVYSNTPAHPETTWGQSIFPVKPLAVAPGGQLTTRLDFDRSFDQGLWKWHVEWSGAGDSPPATRDGNSFAGLPISGAQLRTLMTRQQ